ncbi:MAG: hypothetical protein K2N38_10915 [Oscillospiraceae bacterium]|nr:hypothetical protein [Oscillospiraceae bacterium]
MRVFDSYFFNIIEKVSFGETKPYLEKMLSDLRFSYQNIAFMLYGVRNDAQKKALEKLPSLGKYSFSVDRDEYGLCSYSTNWREGEFYADKADWKDISVLFSKVPRPFNFSFGHLILDGINWFPDSENIIGAADDWIYRLAYPTASEPPFLSNTITQWRDFEDGKKINLISICIDVTDNDRPRSSHAIIEKLIPYLGEPQTCSRKCSFSREEKERFNALEKEEQRRFSELAKSGLPVPKNIASDTKFTHVADKFTLDKAFKGTAFTRQKGQPNYLHLYSCTDEHGFLYEAYTQRLEVGINRFRVWARVLGCNFQLSSCEIDYKVTEEGESLEILKQFAEFCVRLRDEHGSRLAEKFGETPAWYNEKLI